MTEGVLPLQFRDLEPYLDWSLPTEQARSAKRQTSSMAEISGFYTVMLPRLEAILSELARHAPDTADTAIQRLSNLALALAEIAPAVENYGQPSVVDGYDVSRFVPLHA